MIGLQEKFSDNRYRKVTRTLISLVGGYLQGTRQETGNRCKGCDRRDLDDLDHYSFDFEFPLPICRFLQYAEP